MVTSKVNNNTYKLDFDREDELRGTINGEEFELTLKSERVKRYSVTNKNSEYKIDVVSVDLIKKSLKILVNGMVFDVEIEDEFDAIVNRLGFKNKTNSSEKFIKALMPGLILSVHVSEGDNVIKGQNLLTLEAMKMENIVKSTGDFKIKKINIEKGDTVEKNNILFELE